MSERDAGQAVAEALAAGAHAAHYGCALGLAELAELGTLLPGSARELVRCIGAQAALALLNAWPGVVVPVPRSAEAGARSAQRWARIEEIVGGEAMQRLAAEYGGDAIEVPTCEALRAERRRRWIRARYDALTASDRTMTKTQAVHELGVALAAQGQPMSYRAIESALDSPDSTQIPSRRREADQRQVELWPETRRPAPAGAGSATAPTTPTTTNQRKGPTWLPD